MPSNKALGYDNVPISGQGLPLTPWRTLPALWAAHMTAVSSQKTSKRVEIVSHLLRWRRQSLSLLLNYY